MEFHLKTTIRYGHGFNVIMSLKCLFSRYLSYSEVVLCLIVSLIKQSIIKRMLEEVVEEALMEEEEGVADQILEEVEEEE